MTETSADKVDNVTAPKTQSVDTPGELPVPKTAADLVDDEDDEYHESEDDDYNPGAEKESSSEEDEEDRKLAASYAQIQGGGLIKSRRQEAPQPLKKDPVVVSESSLDVNDLWKQMNEPIKAPTAVTTVPETTTNPHGTDMITISRTFKFAGEVKTETKEVPRYSAEGQDYIKQQQEKERKKQQLKSLGRGPVKRKMSLLEEYKLNKAKKVNTLEKSRLDWLGFVDKEGIKDDLTKHNKNGYLDRQSFLNRVDEKRQQNIRENRK